MFTAFRELCHVLAETFQRTPTFLRYRDFRGKGQPMESRQGAEFNFGTLLSQERSVRHESLGHVAQAKSFIIK
jgi:hypothetical protein